MEHRKGAGLAKGNDGMLKVSITYVEGYLPLVTFLHPDATVGIADV